MTFKNVNFFRLQMVKLLLNVKGIIYPEVMKLLKMNLSMLQSLER